MSVCASRSFRRGISASSSRTRVAARWIGLAASMSLIAGCQTKLDLPSGEEAYGTIAIPPPQREQIVSAIGPGDLLDVQVFGVKELSFENVKVDLNGRFSYPLLGVVAASGKSPHDLSLEMQTNLRRYVVNPVVTIFVKQAALNTVTVLGSVAESGKFKLDGPTTLIDAIAMAKGFTRIADLKQVVVLRVIDGKQYGALFDVRQIQRGAVPDPQIMGNDKVIVGINHLEAAWRDVLLAAPLFNLFIPLYNRN
jgi:polysaccharide biosynthesis/export protein